MNEKVRLTSEIVRVRGHFLVKLTDWQWALAKHGIAAGETSDVATVHMHMCAASADLAHISDSARLLGFGKLADHADQIKGLVDKFMERSIDQPNFHKMLTDVILDLNKFVLACRHLSEQPTVLQDIELPNPRDQKTLGLGRRQA